MFGPKPSPPILGKVVQHHLNSYEKKEPETVNQVSKLYVDDLAFQTYKTAKKIMSEGHFNLRKWRTNSQTLLKPISQAENISCDVEAENGANENVKVLGTSWLTRTDDFHFKFDELIKFAKTLTLTKRNVLRFGSKIYDLLGFLSPFTIRMKCFFKNCALKKLTGTVLCLSLTKEST